METDEQYYLLLLDQEKAFDRVDRTYIRRVLTKNGFPERIVKWIDIIYNHRPASFCINGMSL
jgi:hypothetical protein